MTAREQITFLASFYASMTIYIAKPEFPEWVGWIFLALTTYCLYYITFKEVKRK